MIKKGCLVLLIIILGSVNAKALTNFDVCLQDNLKQQHKTTKTIKTLNCANYQITEVPSLSKYPALESVDLSYNKLTSISKELVANKNLKKLNLNNNEITSIDKRIAMLTKLKELSLAGNSIYYLPKEINKLTKLTYLNLSSTNLLELPKINKLTKLNTLFLENNQLLILPSLSNNPITNLTINNNYLKVKNIKTKSNTYSLTNQNSLTNNLTEIIIKEKCHLYTPEQLLRRNVVSNKGIPLYGIKSYYLKDARDNSNKKVKIEDYIDLKNCEIYQNTNLNGKVVLQLQDSIYETDFVINIKASINNNNSNNNGGNTGNNNQGNNSSNNNDSTLKDNDSSSKDKEESDKKKSAFDGITTKSIDEKKASQFYAIDNAYLLSAIMMLFILIPLLLIARLMSKIKNSSINIQKK